MAAAEDDFRKLGADLAAAGPKAEKLAGLAVAKATIDGEWLAISNAPVDTGYHRQSITSHVKGLQGEFGPTSAYGEWLELGTSRTPPRPHIFPALDWAGDQLVRAVDQIAGMIL